MLRFGVHQLSLSARRATGGKARNHGAYALGAVQGAMAISRLDWAAWAVWQVRPGERLEFQAARAWWVARCHSWGVVVLHETPSPLVSAGVVMVDKTRAFLTIRGMNENAQALGRLAKGKPKTLTPEQRAASADRMRAAQKLRWKNKARQEQA